MKKVIIRIFGPADSVLAAVWGGYRFFQQLPQRQEQVATAKVRRGDVVIRAFSRGELRAVRSVTLTAPNLFSTVQVTRLAPMGSLAKEKDLIVEFDDSERRAALEETLLEVEQIDEQIKKAQGRPGHPRQPGPGGPAAHALRGAPRGTGSQAQRTHLGDRREEEPAQPGRAEAAAGAAGERHQDRARSRRRRSWRCCARQRNKSHDRRARAKSSASRRPRCSRP